MAVNKQYFTMIQVRNALEQIADKMADDKWEPDVIMGINRGGCIPGVYLSHRLNKPHEALDVRLRDHKAKPDLRNLEKAYAFQKKYVGGALGSSEGMLQREVIYYKDTKDTKGTEITLDNYFMADIAREEEIITPIYEEQNVTKMVPFVTFDKDGEEIIKKKKITKLEKVKVGENKEIRQVFDPSLISNIFEFTYGELRKILSKHFPIDKLEIV